MKKLFICVMTSLCSTFAFAEGELVVNKVTIPVGGSQTMEVTIGSPTTFTAFQFDMKLPKGVSVTGASVTNPGAKRKVEIPAQVDATTNTWRFLSYDEENALLAEGTKLNVTLAAAATAEAGKAEAGSIVLVTPAGAATEVNVVPSVDISLNAPITVGKTGKSTLVSDRDLDFSSLDNLKAYIATGYDKDANKIWLTRVKDVPAGTPVMLIGPETEGSTNYQIPTTTSTTYYPENYLKGSATEAVSVDNSYFNMALMSGTFGELTDATFPKGKCYLQLPKTIASNVGSSENIKIGSSGKKSFISSYDLDFTSVDGLRAYTVTGYSKGTIWLTQVKKVPANTALYLDGTANTTYPVPSVAIQSSYINMLKGDAANNTALTMTSTVDEINYTNCVLQGGHFTPLSADEPNFPKGVCYLPIPTSYITASSRGEAGNIISSEIEESEVISIMLSSIGGENDGATSIRSIGEVQTDDAWYNLKGQRIDTPTKKGLYIKNGKKVVVK